MIIRRCDHLGCSVETYENESGKALCARHRIVPEAIMRAELVLMLMIAAITVVAAVLVATASQP